LRAVVGLGNPGPSYAFTRHNLGFWVLERLLNASHWELARFPWGEVYRKGGKFLLRPLTFMNLSGEAVLEFSRRFGVPPSALLLVYDDVDLPLGEVRLRPSGGPGTHRGMRSVLEALGTEEVPRLRVGIGPPPSDLDLAQFVLSPPKPEEVPILNEACDFAAELALVFLEKGLQAALDLFSRRRPARPV